MELIKKQIPLFIQKYKFVILIALIGIVLMLLPSSDKTIAPSTEKEKNILQLSSMQDELENILSQIDGAGTVRVLLKERTGTETIYQTNEDTSDSSSKVETVLITDSDRNETGLIKQINPPQYIGVIVLCQGAENPTVKLAVADAVSKVTGLGLDKIAVLKMK